MKLSNKNKNNDPILEYWIAFDLHMKFLYFKILQNNLFVRVDPVFQSVRVNPVFQSVRVDPIFQSVRVDPVFQSVHVDPVFLSVPVNFFLMFTCLLYLFKTLLLLTFFYHHRNLYVY